MKYDPKEFQNYYKDSKRLLSSEIDKHAIEELRRLLVFHEWRYYVLNDPIISDYEYDQLFKKLQLIEKQYPELVTRDSPTQRVSTDLTETFNSVPHLIPMLSLANSYDEGDLLDFDQQVKKLCNLDPNDVVEYSVEPKFDGGSIALVYENDYLVRAATRGNGTVGEEITANAKTLPTVPLKVRFSAYGIHTLELRGEAVIPKDKFKIINDQRAKQEKALFANPRNTATGGLRTKNPSETRNRHIEVFIFQLAYATDMEGNDMMDNYPSHYKILDLLSEQGFKVPRKGKSLCDGINGVISLLNDWELTREDYPYEVDGLVIKVNQRKLQKKCGSTSHHPRWAIAYKFKAKQASTQLLDVVYQVGKTGSITPVAKLEPVQLAGVMVSSVSLHNEEFIQSKDLRLGDTVLVERAGDVIPYIVKALEELRNGSETLIQFPGICPVNSSEKPVSLIKDKDEAAWRCPKCVCGAQDLQRIIFHVSKSAMDIDGFGKSHVERFYELGWIRDFGDVYNLNFELIAELEGFGIKSAKNLQSSIQKAKKNPLYRLLHSLCIHHLGKKASKLIAAEINYLWDLKSWTLEDFIGIKDIGPVVAENVIEFFKINENILILEKMEKYGVNFYQTEGDKPLLRSVDGPLSGKSILFTGTLSKMGRKEAQRLAEIAGAKILSAVSKKLDILVYGEKAGSKLKKAKTFETVDIISEDEFARIIGYK